MKILVAGVLAAVAMFIWSAVAHLATPLAATGISQMENEKAVLDGMKQGAGAKSALFIFPWVDMKDPHAMEKEAGLMKHEPSGFLVYHPPGRDPSMVPMLIHEFIKELAQCLLAAFLLSLTMLTGYAARVGFVAGIGVFAAFGQDASYLIWYGFPLNYTLAQMTIGIVQALVAGLVIAAILKPRIA